MRRNAGLLMLLAGSTTLSGCAAALAPVIAGGAIGGRHVLHRKDGREATPPAPATSSPPPIAAAVRPAGRQPVSPSSAPPPAAPVPSPASVALPTHEWRTMVVRVAEIVQANTKPVDGAVLAPGATLASPRFLPCEAMPLAVIVDAEGTVLPASDAPPGTIVRTEEAAKSFGDLRFGHVTVMFTSSRPPAEMAATKAALEQAGLGPVKDRELLMGASRGNKDAMRTAAAQRFCVVALVGDEPGDFSDQLAANAASSSAPIWGKGWFRIPAQRASR